MEVGNKVKLTGITRHGKNRVREQGETWEVIRMSSKVGFKTSAPGPFVLLQATESINMRWVSTVNDDNFSVEVIDE
jgi:hypothetical protein